MVIYNQVYQSQPTLSSKKLKTKPVLNRNLQKYKICDKIITVIKNNYKYTTTYVRKTNNITTRTRKIK